MINGKALWSALPHPMLAIDANNCILSLNPACEQLLLASTRGAKGKPVLDVLKFDLPLNEAFDRVRANDAPVHVNEVGLALHGSAHRGGLHIAPLGSSDSALLLCIGLNTGDGGPGRDDEGRRAARSAIGMAEMLAHEIKNPLAGITGAAQLLSMALDDEDRALTELIVQECQRVVKLLEQVEAFGNLSPPELAPVNLHDVLGRAQRTAMLGFAGDIKFVESYDPSLPPALADFDQLQQVLLNLIRNATEAMNGTGTIELVTRYDHSFRSRRGNGESVPLPLQIEVIDDGPGVPDDLAPVIFDAFVSGKANGRGLGLALSAKIISAHGGLISLKSKPGKTSFRISLPRAVTPERT